MQTETEKYNYAIEAPIRKNLTPIEELKGRDKSEQRFFTDDNGNYLATVDGQDY